MALAQPLARSSGPTLSRRLVRSMPWISGAIALVTLGSAIRRKGVFGGTLDTALNFIPFVGAVKIFSEGRRGRDFIRERRRSVRERPRPDERAALGKRLLLLSQRAPIRDPGGSANLLIRIR